MSLISLYVLFSYASLNVSYDFAVSKHLDSSCQQLLVIVMLGVVINLTVKSSLFNTICVQFYCNSGCMLTDDEISCFLMFNRDLN